MNPKHPLSTITVYRLVASFILAISIYSCANMSRPGGGPRDETPPVFIKSMPVPNALNRLPPPKRYARNSYFGT